MIELSPAKNLVERPVDDMDQPVVQFGGHVLVPPPDRLDELLVADAALVGRTAAAEGAKAGLLGSRGSGRHDGVNSTRYRFGSGRCKVTRLSGQAERGM